MTHRGHIKVLIFRVMEAGFLWKESKKLKWLLDFVILATAGFGYLINAN